ncbi:MAG: MerR family transcriptional regulator [Isosphaeraceae bacterium]
MSSELSAHASDSPAPNHGLGADRRERGPEVTELAKAPEYSIAAVSKLTGISCHTLRVWERRYRFPIPDRSPSGHRRYTRGQVQALCHLTHLTRVLRQPIGELISKWRAGELKPGDGPQAEGAQAEEEPSARLVNRLAAGDQLGAECEYESLASRLDPSTLLDRVLCPALIEAGDGWFRRNYAIYQERLITVFLRKKLSSLIDSAVRANTQPSRSVIVGTVQGDRHEGGVLAFTLAMELRGWRVHNLGVDLPVPQYQLAAQRLQASAVALSFVLSRNIKKRFHELGRLRDVPVFVGGRSIVNYQSLARSCGLIPVVGPIGKTADLFVAEFEHWARTHAERG